MSDTTTSTSPVDGETRVGSDGVTITCTIGRGGNIFWRDPEGQLHNPDGPAFLAPDGEQMWCWHGPMHRDGGLPAHIDRFGVKQYRVHGVRHRDGDLPAIEGPERGPWRGKEFFVNGARHRDGGQPAVVNGGGRQFFVNGVRHRDDGQPAVETSDGRIEFWVDGKLHNPTGPAIVKADRGGEEFWLNGVRYSDVWAYKEAGGVYDVPVVRAAPEPEPKQKRISRKKAA